MNRRRFLGALTGLASVGSLMVGSGALTTSRVNRDVLVNIADDDEAYLALDELGSGGRSFVDGGQIRFSIPGVLEEYYSDTDASGVGTNSVYRFGSDIGGDGSQGLFAVENRGSQPVVLYSTQRNDSGKPSVKLYDVETDELLTERSPSSPLGVGERLRVGLVIDTRGVPVQEDEYLVSLLIEAASPGTYK